MLAAKRPLWGGVLESASRWQSAKPGQKQQNEARRAIAHPALATKTSIAHLPVATRVLNDPSDECAEIPSGISRQFRHKRRACHAGLCVDFQADQFTRSTGRIVKAEVRTAHATAAQGLMRRKCQLP